MSDAPATSEDPPAAVVEVGVAVPPLAVEEGDAEAQSGADVAVEALKQNVERYAEGIAGTRERERQRR